MSEPKTISLGQLKSELAWLWDLADDTEVYFGAGDLSLYRPKTRLYKPDDKTPAIVQIEFNEIYAVTMDPDTDA